ncbi:hypothetical protein [Aquabacterium humicola]|uniref:hypothetical protein n=1 Tax=Aquabacterium humicola TaxID=3237377 RepID=UPI0025439801|nr:hypothetical protein [Rubrivivax pictus]
MESILLTELDKRIRASADSVSWARDMCRAASHHARQGQADVALKWLDSVKQHFGKRIDPEVACWLMLAEGLVHYYQLRWVPACDLFRGAYGIAFAFNAESVRPACAAWIALIEFNESNFDSMIRFLDEALCDAAVDDHQCRARASLTLADALNFCSSLSKAQPWYKRARHHAAAEGDGATMNALMHNMAAYQAARVRIADAFGTPLLAEAKQASMQASSAFSYARAVGLSTWMLSTAPLLQAQTLAIQGQYDDALRLLSAVDAEGLPPRDRAMLAIERAWCLAQLNCFEHVEAYAVEATRAEEVSQDADDLAYIYARLAAVEDRMGRKFVENCAERAADALAKHRDVQQALEAKLDALDQRLKLLDQRSAGDDQKEKTRH